MVSNSTHHGGTHGLIPLLGSEILTAKTQSDQIKYIIYSIPKQVILDFTYFPNCWILFPKLTALPQQDKSPNSMTGNYPCPKISQPESCLCRCTL